MAERLVTLPAKQVAWVWFPVPARPTFSVEKWLSYVTLRQGARSRALQLVIDRKRIFLFRPKTNIRQENAAEYSADNEYSAQGSKHCKKVNLYKEKNSFLGWQLQVAVDGHNLWATETYMQKTLTMLT
jgi:hypothetical protein